MNICSSWVMDAATSAVGPWIEPSSAKPLTRSRGLAALLEAWYPSRMNGKTEQCHGNRIPLSDSFIHSDPTDRPILTPILDFRFTFGTTHGHFRSVTELFEITQATVGRSSRGVLEGTRDVNHRRTFLRMFHHLISGQMMVHFDKHNIDRSRSKYHHHHHHSAGVLLG